MATHLVWLTLAAAVAAIDHQIHTLPGYADKRPIDFNQYAGHLALPSNGQKMFYWLIESENYPTNDPLVLWLNGGPGCSSLGGFFTELGPFVVQSDLSVKRNKYAWNRKANMVFLESPAGVGFSEPMLPDNEYNDDTTAARTREFLEQFLLAYPAYQHRPLFITGESYAGRYIPFLLTKLIEAPLETVNLRGFAIGNPSTNYIIDHNAYVDYYYSHGLLSMENYEAVKSACGHDVGRCVISPLNCTDACENALQEGILAINETALNPYYIYGDVCLLNNSQAYHLKYRHLRPLNRGRVGPCTDTFTQQYLRLPAVLEALHVTNNPSWTSCNDAVSNVYHKSDSSMELYPKILSKGLQALIYSGDADMVVNFLGTQRWISRDGLKLRIKTTWHAWFGPDKQLAGYTEEYDGLNFTTVKGAGHMVPAVRPLHALYMFECFVYGHDACASFDYPKDSLEYLSGEDVVAYDDDDDDDTKNFSPTGDQVIDWSLYGMFVVIVCVAIAAIAKKQLDRKRQYEAL
ncbi:hypothetical protein LEN26_001312 [Aphanomyces euteiches]|nr:hypothetical protein AeMF1_015948 [Aphanomyces euteiches]KAH9161703.1 hypothetical protein LEN26_001312 [Aphanomyces euteiches]KAH9197461.1 hypothetical protein AeNC1_000568 [Aphanomyces euteiches]